MRDCPFRCEDMRFSRKFDLESKQKNEWRQHEECQLMMKTARNSVSGKVGIFKESTCDPPHPLPLPSGQWH